jgi:hypothetical protein
VADAQRSLLYPQQADRLLESDVRTACVRDERALKRADRLACRRLHRDSWDRSAGAPSRARVPWLHSPSQRGHPEARRANAGRDTAHDPMNERGITPTDFRLVLMCVGVLLVCTLSYPTAVGAQARDDIPEELWQIYPLDPRKGDAGAPDTVQPQPPPGSPAQTDSAVQTRSESPNAQGRPSEQSGAGRSLAIPLLGALLGLLVILLVAATVRDGAFAIVGGYLARAGSPLVSPLRGVTAAPRYVRRGRSPFASPLRGLPGLPRRIGHLLRRLPRALAGIVTPLAQRIRSAVAARSRRRTRRASVSALGAVNAARRLFAGFLDS